ncbi:MAG TPA: chemotaxis protein CheW [Spirochaetota bacterium]|nr:chemotaxis protein CheW [Spirochaetota bacterium]HPH02101.1 chemotaxis protein CheW [Spirochaetota bacterium]HPN82891.1 chemotaxis protein CheW [Spirochaetota bacterium]
MATTSAATNREQQRTILARPGKYLTFKLGEELYAVDILKVQEIIGMQSVIRIPKTPQYVRGMINLRDRVIPIIDLRLKFDMEHKEDTRRTCIIVLQVSVDTRQVIIGAVVDEVSEVIDLNQDELQPAPSFGSALDTHMIIGIGRTKEKVIMLLDADTLLSTEEIFSLKEVARQAAAQTRPQE